MAREYFVGVNIIYLSAKYLTRKLIVIKTIRGYKVASKVSCWRHGSVMRIDVLTITVLIFVIGLLLSCLSFSDVFSQDEPAPAPHQQGFSLQ